MKTLLFLPACAKGNHAKIESRIGIDANAVLVDQKMNLFDHVVQLKGQTHTRLSCVLVDEAQFLKKEQVEQLCQVTDDLNIPVLAYGIRSDFQGNPFEGSLYLLTWADALIELKTVCFCGKKATMNLRISEDGKAIRSGNQVLIGKTNQYISLCRKHFNHVDQLPDELCQRLKSWKARK